MASSSGSAAAKEENDGRLFVGNLASSVSEHDLLALFRPFGTLRSLNLIFHRSGEQKGQHKGYAFIVFASKESATSALNALDGTQLRGRDVHVNYAVAASNTSLQHEGVGPHRRLQRSATRGTTGSDLQAGKTTMLSLTKNLNRKDSTDSRIAAMEAKLDAIRSRNTSSSSSKGAKSAAALSSLPVKPSHLPPKPPPAR